VCEIGPVDPKNDNWGQVEVEVKGGKRGTSTIYFTYRVNTHDYYSLPLLLLLLLPLLCTFNMEAFSF